MCWDDGFCEQQCLTSSRSLFTLHLFHLPVLLCYNASKLLSTGADEKQEHPFTGGQKQAESSRDALGNYSRTPGRPAPPCSTPEGSEVGRMVKLPATLAGPALLTLHVSDFVSARRVLLSRPVPPHLFQSHFWCSTEEISNHNCFIMR